MDRFAQKTLQMAVRKWQSEPQSIEEVRLQFGAWVAAQMFSFVRCVEPKGVGIGTWPEAGLPLWSSTASRWQSRRFQLLTALQSNVPAKRFF
jgi:hypothetical protein